jgi:hypothetical protein
MSLHELIKQISSLEDAEVSVGRGPKHSSHETSSLAQLLQNYFADFPTLGRDDGYVEFMEYYAGMHIYKPAIDLSLDIFSFTNASSTIEKVGNDYLLWGESRIVEEGFLVFCDASLVKKELAVAEIIYPSNSIGAGFAFDITGHQVSGVYRTKNTEHPFKWYWYCDTFITWLNTVVKYKANLPLTVT